MKRQIRRRCFETNSSSTHAICIAKSDVDKSYLPSHVTFTHGEFGWENNEYSDLWSKASYLYQAICDCYDEHEKEEAMNNISEVLGSYGITCNFEPNSNSRWSDGYIDHGYEAIDFVITVLNDSDKLLRYLFGDSMVITGNDNGDGFSDRMYVNEGKEVTKWGTYTNYGGLKPEFNNYDVYMKGN